MIWLRDCLSYEFELKSEILGLDYGEVRSSKFLGREIRIERNGIERTNIVFI